MAKTSPGNAVIIIPEPGAERALAMRLYAARTPLYVDVLDALARRSGLRYNELLPLVGGGSKNLLTKALQRLQIEGAVTGRGMGERTGYELTPHGVAVRDAIVEYRALDRLRSDLPRSASSTPA